MLNMSTRSFVWNATNSNVVNPNYIAITQDDQFLYIASEYLSTNYSVVRMGVLNRSFTRYSAVATTPYDVAVSSDGTQVFCTSNGSVPAGKNANSLVRIYVSNGTITRISPYDNGTALASPPAVGSYTPGELPVANFTSNVTSGNAPVCIQFNDTSTGSPTAWNWTFGDGTGNFTTQNVTHLYTSPGLYNVTLTVRNPNGTSTRQVLNYTGVGYSEYSLNKTEFYLFNTGEPATIGVNRTTFTYDVPITIYGSTDGVLDSYQVALNVYNTSGTNKNGTIYLNGHARNFPNDFLFLDANGTSIPYWVEEGTNNTTYAHVWVNVTGLPASPGTKTIYMYYGAPMAPSRSNSSATFQFIDDFDGTDINPVWSAYGVSQSAGLMVLDADDHGVGEIDSFDSPFNRGVDMRFRGTSSLSDGSIYGGLTCEDYALEYRSDAQQSEMWATLGISNDDYYTYYYYPWDMTRDAWHIYDIQWVTDRASFYVDNVHRGTFTDDVPETDMWPSVHTDYGNWSMDWLFIRNYTTHEPVASPKKEQPIAVLPGAINYTTSDGSLTSTDYTAVSGIINFSTGDYTHVLQVPIPVNCRPGYFYVNVSPINGKLISPNVSINIIAPVSANFTSNVTAGDQNLCIQFNDTSEGQPETWEWNFGDGTENSTLQNPVHTFPTPGYYNVTLTVTNHVSTSTLQRTGFFVGAIPPYSDFRFDQSAYMCNDTDGTVTLSVDRDTFGYVMPLTIFHDPMSQDNYQLHFDVYNTSGTSSSNTIYLNGHSQNFPNDIRFVEDGNALPYWIESGNETHASVWVNFTNIPQSTSTPVYVYYGSPTAQNYSNADRTFLMYDDFQELNPDLWSITGSGSTSVNDGYMRIYAYYNHNHRVTAKQSFGSCIIDTRFNAPNGDYNNDLIQFAGGINTQNPNGEDHSLSSGGEIFSWPLSMMWGVERTPCRLDSSTWYTSEESFNSGQSYGWEIIGTNYNYRSCGTGLTSITPDYAVGSFPASNYHFGDLYIDYMFVRNYSSGVNIAYGHEFSVPASRASVSYSTADGTATQPAFYRLTSGTLDYDVFDSSKSFPIPIIYTGYIDNMLFFYANISSPVNGSITQNTTIFINNAELQASFVSNINENKQDICLDGHSLSWPNDIRFTDTEDNPLPYWIESSDDDMANVWVNVSHIPVSPEVTILKVYYGKANDTGESDGNATFLFFDDFNSSINMSKWASATGGSGTCSIVDGALQVSSPVLANNFGRVTTINSLPVNNVAVDAKYRTYITSHGEGGADSACSVSRIFYPVIDNSWQLQTISFTSIDPDIDDCYRFFIHGYYGYQDNVARPTIWSDWINSEVRVTGSNVYAYKDGAHVYTDTIINLSSSQYRIQADGGDTSDYGSQYTQVDYVFIRNFTPNEPLHQVIGLETSAISPDGYAYNKSYAIMGSSDGALTNYPVKFIVHKGNGIDRVNAPYNVSFIDTSSGEPETWNWSFGDGSPNSTIQNPTHYYVKPGIYDVSLTVTHGTASSTIKRIGYVNLNETPVASFMSNVTGGYPPFSVQFNDTSSYGPTAWNWSFGDGTYSNIQNATHTYTTDGVYTVMLSATNANGTNTKTIMNYIRSGANFTGSVTNGSSPLRVQFIDTSASSTTSWNWNFGDGSPNSTIQNPVHTYYRPGQYTVTLTTSDSVGHHSTICLPSYITVAGGGSGFQVTAEITEISPGSTKTTPYVLQLNCPTPGLTWWEWNFGDGSKSYEQSVIHNFDAGGNSDVTLTAGNGTGSGICHITITLPIIAGWYAEGDDSLTVQFHDNSFGKPNGWEWDFGDGSPNSTSSNPVHTFPSDGVYTVTITAYNTSAVPGMISSTHQAPIVVPAYGTTYSSGTSGSGGYNFGPTVNVYSQYMFANKLSPPVVQFNATSPGLTWWNWNFNDGTTSTEQNVSHTFYHEGHYNVTLTCGNSTSNGKSIISVTILPYVNAYATDNGSLTVHFYDYSFGNATSWNWSFGDGSPNSTLRNPIHTFPAAGQYMVLLTAVNDSAKGGRVESTNGWYNCTIPQYNLTNSNLTVPFNNTSWIFAVTLPNIKDLSVSSRDITFEKVV